MASYVGNLLQNLLGDVPQTIGRGARSVAGDVNNSIRSLLGYINLNPSGTMTDYVRTPSPTPSPIQTPTPTPTPTPQQFERLTYYLPTGNPTATGTTPQSGYTAAISRQLLGDIPMGTLIQLPNGQVVRVEDVTDEDILNTLDIFYGSRQEATYPQGMERNVPYQIVGRNTEGLKYNY